MKNSFMMSLLLTLSFALFPIKKVMSNSNDFGNWKGDIKALSNQNFRHRFELIGEIFILDATGKKLITKGREHRSWRIGGQSQSIESNWSTKLDGYPEVAIKHQWKISPDNTLTAKIQQYDSMSRGNKRDDVKVGKLISETEKVLENFSELNWIAFQDKNYRVVVRFTPVLNDEESIQTYKDMPLSASDLVVTDNQGYMWTDNLTFEGKYVGIITHRGELVLSFSPFKNAKEIGFAKDNEMEVNP